MFRCLLFSAPILFIHLSALTANAQWLKVTVDTKASLRGLSVVSAKVVWASGSSGTVIRTIDGGKTWKVMTVPGAENLDFRDVEAFDRNTAYVLSIGNGPTSRIYKTTDGGATWKEQFRNTDEKAFFDAIACWSRDNCVAMSDPVDRSFLLLVTVNGGDSWHHIESNSLYADEGEASFAASGTCLITSGRDGIYLVSGGSAARVYRSTNRMWTWSVSETGFVKGTPGSGIFSIAMFDSLRGVIVGGNYQMPNEAVDNLAFTGDGGKTWSLASGLSGYRSGVAYIDSKTIVAVGTNGTDISSDGGRTWRKSGSENLNAVAAKGRRAVWAVGPNGTVVRM